MTMNRFRSLWGGVLMFSLQGIYHSSKKLSAPPELIYFSPSGQFLAYPAEFEGCLEKEGTMTIIFKRPEEVPNFERIIFRSKQPQAVRFWRPGETNTFGFSNPYLGLDFLSKTSDFVPVYAKIKVNGGEVVLFIELIEADDEKVIFQIGIARKEEVPGFILEDAIRGV